MLISKRDSTDIRHSNDFEAFIEYSNDMYDIYINIEEYDPNKKRKILIVFDDMIVDMLTNEKIYPIVTGLFVAGRKLSISLVFIKQLYFAVPKNVTLNLIHYFIMKIPNKGELQQIAFKHTPDTDFKYFVNLYKKVL